MKIIVIGSKNWTNYEELMRKMTVVVYDWVRSNPEDKVLTVLHTGSRGAEDMISDYVIRIRKLSKQNGYTIKEKIYSIKNYPEEFGFMDRDRDMIENGGAEKALVFIKDSCKRSTGFAKLASAYGIETEIIRE
jgi:hypothetical protein